MNIVLLGIDGAGKSSIATELKNVLELRDYNVDIVPFHKWIIADKIRDSLGIGRLIDRDRKNREQVYKPKKKSLSAFIKPPVALIDNVIYFLLIKSWKKNNVVIFDRFISATQIKLTSLNYCTKWLKPIWWNLSMKNTFVLDIDVCESLKTQEMRNDEYLYEEDGLSKERELYINLAKDHHFTLIDNRISINYTINQILKKLSL
tara:strand:- start:56 stop:667 length:612 start_codon:yes stop_codon:yes gene_type:complete